MSEKEKHEVEADASTRKEASETGWISGKLGYAIVVVLTAGVTIAVLALLTNIFERKREATVSHHRVAEVDESTTDPAVWGKNWPSQYDSYKRTVDYDRTKYGGK